MSKNKRAKKHLLAHPTLALSQNIDFLEEEAANDYSVPSDLGTIHRKKEKCTPLVAKTETQKEYIRAIIESPQVICFGPSGVGKTYIAARMAADMLRRGEIEKIVLTRPNVSQSKSLGYFKGSMDEKLAPWVVPYTDVLEEEFGKSHFEYLVKRCIIDIVPFEVMRGRTFNKSFVILDEAQNVTIPEIKMFVTRIGEESKVVMNGDVRQKDIPVNCGLSHVISLAKKYSIDVSVVEFTHHDIVRSGVCKQWVVAFESDEKSI